MTDRPYDENLIPPYETIATYPTSTVPIGALHATQHVVLIDVILSDEHEGPDPHPHVIEVDGKLYVHNGHHRWLRAWLRDEQHIDVRIAREGSVNDD